MSAPRPVLSSAKRIALCTLISRITGLTRDVLLAQAFALSWVQDALQYAFNLPNLFRRLFGEGSLAAVFVPTFMHTLETQDRESAWKLLARTIALFTTTLIAITILIELIIAAIWLLTPAAGSHDHESRRLLLSLTAMMFPFMISICLLALLGAILNCVGSFVPAALAPVLLNVCMIAAILWFAPAKGAALTDSVGVYGIAASVLVAGVLQLLFLLPALRAHGVRLGWQFTPRDPSVKKMLRLAPPVALGQGVLAFGVFLDQQVCILLTRTPNSPPTANWFGLTFDYPLEAGALSAISYAARLYQFPLGVLVISLATAALPAFARYAVRSEWTAWSGEVRSLLRLAIFEGILTGAMMFALAEPIVRLLFEYRQFSAADTLRTANVLTWYGLGMWAFCAQHIVLRGFYSLSDAATPLKISCAVLPLNIVLNIALIWIPSIREAGFAISSSITYSLATIVGLLILQRRCGTPILDATLLWALVRMAVIGGACVAALIALQPMWRDWMQAVGGPLALRRALDTFGLLALGTGLFLGMSWLVGLREVQALLGRGRPRAAGAGA